MMLVAAAMGWGTSAAYAFDESTSTIPDYTEANCGRCHTPYFSFAPVVHGGYVSTTTKCAACHDIHGAPGIMLLPGATIQASCYTCHDGTQGRGVYGAIAARGLSVAASHRCESTRTVPGGDAATGGSVVATFSGSGNTLSCDDCHSPHGASVVGTFTPERNRAGGVPPSSRWPTTNLLKLRPGDEASSAAVYGSDWCAACHRGRPSGGVVHNHPVDSTLTTSTPFYYARVALLSTDAPTSVTVFGELSRSNRGYLMPMPRTAQQAGHAPICQQCHEDARNVGTVDPSGAPADAAAWTITNLDGNAPGDNPRFQNFPHEATNPRFLVETNDDLCTNCHPTGILP